jgi:phosphatidylserine/phosphatidylglycerophosphate/cardiolipin synthase-like enzyme
MAERFGPGVTVYGVPVQRREFMGVLHLKGLVIDDHVLYSGASLNDVYLQRHGRYRLDRYHLIRRRGAGRQPGGAARHDLHPQSGGASARQRTGPKTANCAPPSRSSGACSPRPAITFRGRPDPPGEVGITPLLGLGVRDNELNAAILQLIRQVKKQLVLFTPYFNLPGPIRRAGRPEDQGRLPRHHRSRRQDGQRLLHPARRAVQGDRRAALPVRSQPAPLLQGAQKSDRRRHAERASCGGTTTTPST